MDRCPNCRARVSDADHCRRCGMALDLLQQVEAAADAQLGFALSHLTNRDNSAASAALRQALSLRRDPFAEELLAFGESNQGQLEQVRNDAQEYPPSDTLRPLANGYYRTNWS